MTISAEELIVRPLAAGDEPAVLALLEASLAGGPLGERSIEFFNWKHRENPFGSSPGLLALIGDQVVGVRLFMRWEFSSPEGPVRAVRAVDTATSPEHQGKGIFRRLTLALLDEVAADTDLVFNTPNANSLPGYLKFGWQTVGRLPVAIAPLNLFRFARHAQSARTAKPADGPRSTGCHLPPAAEALDGSLDLRELLASHDESRRGITTVRTIGYLRWRYASAPVDYRAVHVRSGGVVTGLAIGRPRWRGALTEFTLTELAVRPGDRDSARLLRTALRRCGTDHIAAHFFDDSPVRQVLGPRRSFTPGPGPTLTVLPIRRIDPDPRRVSSWRLTLGDLELF